MISPTVPHSTVDVAFFKGTMLGEPSSDMAGGTHLQKNSFGNPSQKPQAPGAVYGIAPQPTAKLLKASWNGHRTRQDALHPTFWPTGAIQ